MVVSGNGNLSVDIAPIISGLLFATIAKSSLPYKETVKEERIAKKK
jgi:hypothetical protein